MEERQACQQDGELVLDSTNQRSDGDGVVCRGVADIPWPIPQHPMY